MSSLWSLAYPLLPQGVLKESEMILDAKGASNRHCLGVGEGMYEFVFVLF